MQTRTLGPSRWWCAAVEQQASRECKTVLLQQLDQRTTVWQAAIVCWSRQPGVVCVPQYNLSYTYKQCLQLTGAITCLALALCHMRFCPAGGRAVCRCAKYFVSLGVKKENLLAVDVKVRPAQSAALYHLSTCMCSQGTPQPWLMYGG